MCPERNLTGDTVMNKAQAGPNVVPKYWVVQKFHLEFSVTVYGKTEKTFWPTQY